MSDPDETDAMSLQPSEAPGRLRRAAGAAARSIRGLIGIAIAALVIGAAGLVPLASIRHTAPRITVTPLPAAQQLICPGALVRLGDEGGKDATSVHDLGIPSTVSAATVGSVDSTPLKQPAADGKLGAAPTVISTPVGTAPSTLVGAQSQAVHSADFRGFGAVQCAEASTNTWLVGGSTALGRTTIVILANPSDFVATADIHVFGGDGTVSSPGSSGILIAAQSAIALSLAGFAPDLEAPVVHVTSTGGPISATLQQAITRGIEPGGVDYVGPAGKPTNGLVFPGLVIQNSAAVAGLLGEDGFKDAGTVLRVFVPGNKDASARISVVPEDTSATGASFSIDLKAGVVSEIPIDGLEDGTYSVSLASDQPAVAALRASTVSDQPDSAGFMDFAWFGSSNPLTGSAFVTIAPGAGSELHLGNPGLQAETILLRAADGTSQAVTVPAGSSHSIVVTPGSSYQLDGFTTIYASVSYVDGGKIASYAVSPSRSGPTPVTIYP
jgi:Family of unknown function (DUF5719)